MKKETVDEAAKNIYIDFNPYLLGVNVGNWLTKEAFKKGAKWQQERMYSIEEVDDLLEMLERSISEINHLKYTYKDKGHCGKYLSDCENIIEKLKNKTK